MPIFNRPPENPDAYRGALGIPQPSAGEAGGGLSGFASRLWRGAVRGAVPDNNIRGYLGSGVQGGPAGVVANALSRGVAGGLRNAFGRMRAPVSFDAQSSAMAGAPVSQTRLVRRATESPSAPRPSTPSAPSRAGTTPFIARSNTVYSNLAPGYLAPGLAGPDQTFAGPPAPGPYGSGTGVMRDTTLPTVNARPRFSPNPSSRMGMGMGGVLTGDAARSFAEGLTSRGNGMSNESVADMWGVGGIENT